ncbi:MAG: ABC transporter substrate-binding protein [Salinigranum sp.]
MAREGMPDSGDQSVSRRRVIQGTGLASLAGLVGLAGCTGGNNDNGGSGGNNAGGSSGGSTSGGSDTGSGGSSGSNSGDGSSGSSGGQQQTTLRIPLFQSLSNLEPETYYTAANVIVGQMIYEGLLGFDFNYNPVPRVAKKLPETPDNTTYVFELRKGVKTHNGKTITAEDVKASYDWIANPDNSTRAGQFSAVDSLEIVDDHTVKFNLSKPQATFVPLLASRLRFNVVTAESRKGLTSKGLKTKYSDDPQGIGTGPFKLAKWEANNLVVLEKFDEYWGDGIPKIDRVEMPIITDASVRETKFIGKDLDILTKPPRKDIKRLHSMSNFEGKGIPSVRVQTLWINTAKPPLDDWRFRRAIVHAFDTESVIKKAFSGIATPGVGYGIPDTQWVTQEAAQYRGFDLDKAKSFLDKSDYSGSDAKFTLWTIPGRWSDTSQILAQNLSEIGIKCNVVENKYPAVYDHTRNNEAGATLQNVAMSIDPSFMMRRFVHPDGDNFSFTRYPNKEVHKKIDKYMETTNFDERLKLFKEAQTMVAKEAPMFFSVWNEIHQFWYPKVKNYKPHASGWYKLRETSVQS